MQYANWANNREIAQKLKKIKINERLEESGIPIMSENKDLYISTEKRHNLVIGSTGSGKTQAVILPLVKLSIKAGESFLVNDVKGEIYQCVSGYLKSENYNVIAIDFNNALLGNNWNPLDLAYQYYLNNDEDNTIKELENVSYYLFKRNADESDFWLNAASDYFVGLSLYLFENANLEEINLESIYVLGNSIDNKPKEFLNTLDKRSSTYFYLNGVLKSAPDTRWGIMATFNQGLKKYAVKTNLANMLGSTDFKYENIIKEKTAIFIISGNNSDYDNLIPLFIHQIVESIPEDNNKRFNVLLDEFDNLMPIKDFAKSLNKVKYKSVIFTLVIGSFTILENIYGKENVEILKMCFATIIYLLSADYRTLEEISKMCGNAKANALLINPEELKVLNKLETVVLMLREEPIRSKLIPDYQIDWQVNPEEIPLNKRQEVIKKIYER